MNVDEVYQIQHLVQMPRLNALLAELHVFDGVVTVPVRFGFDFEGKPLLRMSARGGDRVCFDRENLKSQDMGNAGSISIANCIDLIPAPVGTPVDVFIIHDGHGNAIGITLKPEDGSQFCIWINDDEFYWGHKIFDASFPDGITPTFSDSEPLP